MALDTPVEAETRPSDQYSQRKEGRRFPFNARRRDVNEGGCWVCMVDSLLKLSPRESGRAYDQHAGNPVPEILES